MRCVSKAVDLAFGEAGRGSECRGVAGDNTWNRLDPWLGQRERRSEVRGRNRIGNGVDEMRSQRTGFRQMVDGPAFVETGHLDCIFHRRSFAVDAQRSLAVLSNGGDATVNLRRELTVYRYLLVTSRLSLRQR